MKTIRVLPCALLLIGCASAPLPPLAQDRARITLDPDVGSLAQAYANWSPQGLSAQLVFRIGAWG